MKNNIDAIAIIVAVFMGGIALGMHIQSQIPVDLSGLLLEDIELIE